MAGTAANENSLFESGYAEPPLFYPKRAERVHFPDHFPINIFGDRDNLLLLSNRTLVSKAYGEDRENKNDRNDL